jgi:hypothetical protein
MIQLNVYTRVDVPETQGAVPRAREGELSIRGDDDVGDEVGVTQQGASLNPGVQVGVELPDDDGLV